MFRSLSRLLEPEGAQAPDPQQAQTMATLLPLPDRRLDGEIVLGSLAFARDDYHAVRSLLVEHDADDPDHHMFKVLRKLAGAPVKTTILLRRGRESTYAKKEIGFLNVAPWVAVHWNASQKDAYDELHVTLEKVLKWMSGSRESPYPSPPKTASTSSTSSRSSVSATVAGSPKPAENPLAGMFKPKATLDFTAEVLRKTRKGPFVS